MHGLGLNLVKERLMRRSYGVVSQPIFRPGVDPQNRRFVDIVGVARCRDVMDWYARKVPNFMANSNFNLRVWRWKTRGWFRRHVSSIIARGFTEGQVHFITVQRYLFVKTTIHPSIKQLQVHVIPFSADISCSIMFRKGWSQKVAFRCIPTTSQWGTAMFSSNLYYRPHFWTWIDTKVSLPRTNRWNCSGALLLMILLIPQQWIGDKRLHSNLPKRSCVSYVAIDQEWGSHIISASIRCQMNLIQSRVISSTFSHPSPLRAKRI